MHASVNLRAAAVESLQRTSSRPRALASFVSRLQKNKVLLATLAEPYLNSVADSLVPVTAHVRSAPHSADPSVRANPANTTASAEPHTESDHHPAAAPTVPGVSDSVTPLGSDRGSHATLAESRVFEPKSSRNGFGVISRIQSIVRKSIFDTYVLPDGRCLRQVRWRELPGLVERFGTSARILTSIMQHATLTVDTGQYVSDVVSEKVVLDAIEEARDAAAA